MVGSEHLLCGVFDGHGPEGGVIANIIATTLSRLLEKAFNEQVVCMDV